MQGRSSHIVSTPAEIQCFFNFKPPGTQTTITSLTKTNIDCDSTAVQIEHPSR
jgi:hypothetical protein